MALNWKEVRALEDLGLTEADLAKPGEPSVMILLDTSPYFTPEEMAVMLREIEDLGGVVTK